MIKEKGLPQLTVPQQTVLVGLLSGLLTGVATVAIVETHDDELKKPELRRERYAALAGSAIVGGIIGAVVLALNAESDGLRGNVG